MLDINTASQNTTKQNLMIDHIPCLYLPYDDEASKVIIYFHGNAEDIGLAFDLLYVLG
jgi:hypothetical protein